MGPEDEAVNLAGLPEPEELDSLDALLTRMLAATQAETDRLTAGAS